MPENEEVSTTEDETRGEGGENLKLLLSTAATAQIFSFIVGVLLLLAGLAALATNIDFSTGSEITTQRLVILDVNGWSGLLMLLSGIALLIGSLRPVRAKRTSLAVGIIYLAVTVWSLFTATVAGVIPINDMTATIFGAVAILSITAGLAPDRETEPE